MRWILRLVAAVVVLGGLAIALLFLLPADRIGRIVAETLSRTLGAEVQFEGGVKPSLLPLGVKAAGLVVSDDGRRLMAADRIEIGVTPLALLSGRIELRQIEIEGADIRLTRTADGTLDWAALMAKKTNPGEKAENSATRQESGGLAASDKATPAAAPLASIDSIRIRRSRLLFHDQQAGREIEIAGLEVDAAMPGPDAAFNAKGKGRINGREQGFQLAATPASALLSGKRFALSLALDGAYLAGTFDGAIDPTSGALAGKSDLKAPNFPALLELVRVPADLPPPLQRVSLAGDVAWKAARLSLRKGRIGIGRQALAGDADLIVAGERPKLVARLTANIFDLAPLLGTGSAATGSSGTGHGDATVALIDPAPLHLLDADVKLEIGKLGQGAIVAENVSLAAMLDRGRLVVDLGKAGIYGGKAAGRFVLNGRKGLSTSLKAQVSQVSLRPLLMASTGFDRLKGPLSGEIDVLGSGRTIDAILRSLKGKATMAIGKGELVGFDLLGMILHLDPNYRGQGNKTIFDKVTATFAINRGIATTADFRLVGPLVDVAGKGTIDLAGRKIDMVLTATRLDPATGAASADAPKVPVRITGPWSGPAVIPLLDQASGKIGGADLAEERKKLESQAKKVLEEKLGPVAPKPGESAEDVLRRKLEEEAKKALGGLLGTQ